LLGLVTWKNVVAIVETGPAQQPRPQAQVPAEPLGDLAQATAIDGFDPFADRTPRVTQAVAPRPTTSRLNLTIDGIAHAPQRGGGLVMLRKGSETLVLGRGDEVARGAHIVEISDAEVIIDNNGRRETAAIQRPKGGSGSTALQARANFSRYVQTLRADNHDD
jgi:type II secretory pathway component PulC